MNKKTLYRIKVFKKFDAPHISFLSLTQHVLALHNSCVLHGDRFLEIHFTTNTGIACAKTNLMVLLLGAQPIRGFSSWIR